MKISKYIVAACSVALLSTTACVGDLDVMPDDPNKKMELTTAEEYYQEFARVYGGLVLEGGVSVDDEGTAVYTRLLWNLQELPTDETLIGKNWNDAGIDELVYSTWSTANHWLYEAYCRFNFQIGIANQFLRTIDNASGLIPDAEIRAMKAEIRTVRDLSYYHIIDIFGKGPWTTEESLVGATPPTYSRQQLYDAVVADLISAIPDLIPASQQVYGRISREAGRMLLAKLYLNAEVYTGTPAWQQCAEQCQEIVKTIPTLAPTYKYLFCGTNNKYVGNGEILWGIPQDEYNLYTFGGTTYLSLGSWLTDSKPVGCSDSNGWGGPRVREELSKALAKSDSRRLIFEGDLTENIPTLDGDRVAGSAGYACTKFAYTPETDYDNANGSTANSTGFNPGDFPLFRLADTFLMLAECQLHNVSCDGLTYFNEVRKRAGLSTVGSYTSDDLLKERMCELYWEGHRRSDLVRFGKFAGSDYNWSWKGGTAAGTSTPAYRNLYGIPYQFVNTLGQNPEY